MGVSLSESTPSSRSFRRVSIVMSTAIRQSRGARDRDKVWNGLRGETQLGCSAFELCESTADVTQRQTETKMGMIDSAALV